MFKIIDFPKLFRGIHIFIIIKIWIPLNNFGKSIILNKIIKLLNYFYLSLETVYETFCYETKFEHFVTYIGDIYLYFKNYETLIYIFLNIIPRFIIVIALFLDICIFHKFFYLYTVLILLILPLILRITLYAIQIWAIKYEILLLNYLDISIVENEKIFKLNSFYESQCNQEDLELYAYFYNKSLAYLIIYDCYLMKNNQLVIKIINSVISGIYIISWGYLIIFMFFK